MARLAEGRTHKAVAEEWGLSNRAVGQVAERWNESAKSLDAAPLEIVEWLAKMELRSIADLEAMAAANADRNPNVALGAKRAAGEARSRYTELMSAVGKLPENLELFRAESVLRGIADEMVETMELLVGGEITAEQAQDAFRRATGTAAGLQVAG